MQNYTIDDAEADLRSAIDADDTATITRLEPVIDALQVRPAATLHQAALYYASIGLHVFPLSPGSKIPFKGTGGCKDATTDLERIGAWWTAEPSSNIGIATGFLVDVIDIDGPPGVRSWIDIAEELPAIIGKVSTPRPGGNHLFVHAVAGRGNKAGIFPGIDYRGTGGYVVAAPSVITGGENPGSYVWYSPLQVESLAMVGAA